MRDNQFYFLQSKLFKPFEFLFYFADRIATARNKQLTDHLYCCQGLQRHHVECHSFTSSTNIGFYVKSSFKIKLWYLCINNIHEIKKQAYIYLRAKKLLGLK